MPDLLYEIGTEELPASYIQPALDSLGESFRRSLEEAHISHGEVFTTGTPRRLVLAARDLAERQADRDEEIVGPPIRVAYTPEGAPTKAAEGFARAQGVTVAQLERRTTPRGEYCVVRKRAQGRPTIDLLAEILPRITLDIPFPKSMTWPGSRQPFARPVRSLLALLGESVVPFTLFGVRTGRCVEGHPILSPRRLSLASADFAAYKEVLKRHHVLADATERRAWIRREITNRSRGIGSVEASVLEPLLDEVTHLVQWPSVTVAHFDRAFLRIPAEVIVAAMTEHQRYFPLSGPDGLSPAFIVVSDRGAEPSDLVRVGNEQVLKARLADAQFFYETDRKQPLEERVERLSEVQFLTGLGTYREKCARLEKLSAYLAEVLGLDPETAAHAQRAAQLCKADLLTEMVGEFPKLQGVMGRIYAFQDGEPEAVARAIEEHYLPRTARDSLPRTPAGLTLSFAEKLDNITACGALDLMPTGSADPYAIRRQSQALLRIVVAWGRHLKLSALFRAAQALLPEPYASQPDVLPRIVEFLRGRLLTFVMEEGAPPNDLVQAALAAGWDDVLDFLQRLEMLRRLSGDAIWPRLVEAVERTFNISRSVPADSRPEPRLYREPLEKRLGELYERHRAEIRNLVEARRYEEASRRYVEVFADTLHEFFETVYVNVDDVAIRNNRLALLRAINRLYSDRIADLSQIVTGVQK